LTVVTTLHAYYSPAWLSHVVFEMARRGAPRIRAYHDVQTGAWFAFEGTHRIRAASLLGIAPVLVPTPWKRGACALERARFAALTRGHSFDHVVVQPKGAA
jgi:hypothetical protein